MAQSTSSSLQVFKQLASMSEELQTLRNSEERHRRDRRTMINTLREVTRALDNRGQDDGAGSVGSLVADLEKILADQGPIPEEEPSSRGSAKAHCPSGSATAETLSPCSIAGMQSQDDDEQSPVPVAAVGSEGSAASEGEEGSKDCSGGSEASTGLSASAASAATRTPSSSSAVAKVPDPLSAEAASATPQEEEERFRGFYGGEQAHLLKRNNSGFSLISTRSWQNDQKACAMCSKVFTLIRRRHHCRSCGRCTCEDCSPFRVRLAAPLRNPLPNRVSFVALPEARGPAAAHRVCIDCHKEPVGICFC
mmetsp:Transcript_138048/g.358560  ORF Transcript_138048/g.358560 Transcript_138048/m.358560 type:complete len:308 (+) Transcript_138048:122-1045(+)